MLPRFYDCEQPLVLSMDIRNETKDEMRKVIKQWYSDIADLHARHELLVFMHDNAREIG
jgi:hypothetical protein